MTAGDLLHHTESVANNAYMTIQPSSGQQFQIWNITSAGAATVYSYDGTNEIQRYTLTAGDSMNSFKLVCLNTAYYRVKNTSGSTCLMSYEGIIWKEA